MTLERITEIPRPVGITDVKGVVNYLGNLATTLQDHMSLRPEDFQNLVAAPGAIGGTTPAAGAFTTITAADIYLGGPMVDVRTYATFILAIAGIGATEATLLIPNEQAVADNVTVPVNVALRFLRGGSLNVATTKTVTINGHVEAGLYQIFTLTGSGVVVFGVGSVGGIYPEWWGVDGIADEVQINAAITAMTSGTVFLGGDYATAASINGKLGVNIIGENQYYTKITYSGSGSAITLANFSYTLLSDISVIVTHDDASGIEIGNDSRRGNIERVYLQGTIATTTTGAGFLLDAGTGWSGGLGIKDCYVLGFKYGVKMIGTHLSNNTWSTVDMTNLWLVGRSAGIVAGSAGIYMDALTNGIGTYLRGGTIESFSTGILVEAGGFGGTFVCDFEGNTANYSVGNTFNGMIVSPIVNNIFTQGTNRAVNKWFQERRLSGDYIHETHYDQRHVIYYNADHEFSLYNGASLIDDGVPTLKWKVQTGGVDDMNPARNYIYLTGRKIAFHSAAPNLGGWGKGSVVYNTGATAGSSPGWVCTTSGTFGSATDNTGDTDGSTAVITGMADTSDFFVGDFVNVSAGFATTGPYEIRATTATSITLAVVSSSAQSNITVDNSDPVFTPLASNVLFGGQLAFPATAVPSADPNTLDDYEEGTWTPTLTGWTNSGTPTVTGIYNKIGRQVLFTVKIVPATNISATLNTSTIAGPPFTPALGAGCPQLNYASGASQGVCLIASDGVIYPLTTGTMTQPLMISGSYIV